MMRWIVDDNGIGQRLDRFVTEWLEDRSRTATAKAIRNGEVKVNGAMVKPNYVLSLGDEILVDLVEVDRSLVACDLSLEVIYEDDDYAIVNKRRGMVVHPTETIRTDTLVNGLLYRFDALSTLNGCDRPGIVHRLDQDTTGVMVIAKNDVCHRALAEQFAQRHVVKEYLALVHGKMPEMSA